MAQSQVYELIRLRNEAWSVYSAKDGETMHPGLGPVEEAESLYVQQLDLPRRIASHSGEFVVWDVGLGAAANALAVIRVAADSPVRIISFDSTVDALSFALNHVDRLTYLSGFEDKLREFIRSGEVRFDKIHWELRLGDFVQVISAAALPPPDAILFDPFSPTKNPAMWTRQLFAGIFRLLKPNQPCALATYSRSTIVRTALLLGGFFVGRGRAVGLKEETTIAANTLDLIRDPLDRRWLAQAERSDSAEPLIEPIYRQAPLTESTREELRRHRQFSR